MGDMGIAGKMLFRHQKALKALGAVCLVILTVGILGWAAQATAQRVPTTAREVLPDTGRQFEETNVRLDEVNRQLREMNSQLEALQKLLTSGKVVVTVKEAPVAGARQGEDR
jgi:hypothetical protein